MRYINLYSGNLMVLFYFPHTALHWCFSLSKVSGGNLEISEKSIRSSAVSNWADYMFFSEWEMWNVCDAAKAMTSEGFLWRWMALEKHQSTSYMHFHLQNETVFHWCVSLASISTTFVLAKAPVQLCTVGNCSWCMDFHKYLGDIEP